MFCDFKHLFSIQNWCIYMYIDMPLKVFFKKKEIKSRFYFQIRALK